MPELPTDTNEGILPREIRALVERRREVKKLMKSERLTEQQRQQVLFSYGLRSSNKLCLLLQAIFNIGCQLRLLPLSHFLC